MSGQSPGSGTPSRGRLSTLAAAYVIARRDFTAILLSRTFIFFLLGPLFPVLIGALAGGIGQRVQQSASEPVLGIAMTERDSLRMQVAHDSLVSFGQINLPETKVIKQLKPGEQFDPQQALKARASRVVAILSGTPEAPVLTGPKNSIHAWEGAVTLMAAQAQGKGPRAYPPVKLSATVNGAAQQQQSRLITAQGSQLLLFLLTMLLAGMVLSNLVEEKGNKIIEVLAAAIPMDAVFIGKLFAMLAISFVGIAVWASAGGIFALLIGENLPKLPEPAVGWPLFIAMGIAYFSMAYLLIGALFLTIGSMATTVREVQTLSMPVSFLQVVFFFLASFAIAEPGGTLELIAIAVPFSSPYAMMARAAQDPALWPHAAAFAWQVLCIGLILRTGARLFRTVVMKSGPAGVRKAKRRWFRRAARGTADVPAV
jgi:ABC-2 type transport system permease protein